MRSRPYFTLRDQLSPPRGDQPNRDAEQLGHLVNHVPQADSASPEDEQPEEPQPAGAEARDLHPDIDGEPGAQGPEPVNPGDRELTCCRERFQQRALTLAPLGPLGEAGPPRPAGVPRYAAGRPRNR